MDAYFCVVAAIVGGCTSSRQTRGSLSLWERVSVDCGVALLGGVRLLCGSRLVLLLNASHGLLNLLEPVAGCYCVLQYSIQKKCLFDGSSGTLHPRRRGRGNAVQRAQATQPGPPAPAVLLTRSIGRRNRGSRRVGRLMSAKSASAAACGHPGGALYERVEFAGARHHGALRGRDPATMAGSMASPSRGHEHTGLALTPTAAHGDKHRPPTAT